MLRHQAKRFIALGLGAIMLSTLPGCGGGNTGAAILSPTPMSRPYNTPDPSQGRAPRHSDRTNPAFDNRGTITKAPSTYVHPGRVSAVAKRVPGVRSVASVVSGDTAIIGVTLNPGQERRAPQIAAQIRHQVQAVAPHLRNIHVTTDASIVSRIASVADGIQRGQPLAQFGNRIKQLINQIPQPHLVR